MGPLNVLTKAASDHKLFSVILVNILQVFFFDHKVPSSSVSIFDNAKQGLFDEAIAIYRKLSLQDLQKSIYFAELIGQLEKESAKKC